jgi:hypothetical protein
MTTGILWEKFEKQSSLLVDRFQKEVEDLWKAEDEQES